MALVAPPLALEITLRCQGIPNLPRAAFVCTPRWNSSRLARMLLLTCSGGLSRRCPGSLATSGPLS